MGDTLRYEAWTDPRLPSFQRVIADIPVIVDSGSGTLRFSDFASGTFGVSAGWDRLTTLISPTVGRLIRAFDGAVIVHEFYAERVDFTLTEAGGVATISGSDIASVFDSAIVYPFDYPDTPTVIANWVWGGADALQNGGMESHQTSEYRYDVFTPGEEYLVWTDASSGDFTLTMESDTTVGIDWDSSLSDFETAITDTTGINPGGVDVTIQFPDADLEEEVPGSVNNKWIVIFSSPHVLAAGVMTGNGAGLGGGSLSITTVFDPALTFTLTYPGNGGPTAAINWNEVVGDMATKIEAIGGITDVTVSGIGNEDDPYRIIHVNPEVLNNPTGSTGDVTVIQTQTGSNEIIDGWVKSQRADQRTEPAYHGTYTIFRQSSGGEPVHSGSHSLVVQGTQYAGIQQIISVTGGGIYQASGWIHTTAASQTYRMVIRDIYEEWVAEAEISPAANTWTFISIADVFAQTYQFEFARDTLVFRVANVTPNATGITYYDDMMFTQGLALENPGGWMKVLMDDATIDHAGDNRGTILTFIDYTSVNNTEDPSGAFWDISGQSFTAFRGATYGQTWDRIRDLGNEWRLLPKTTPVGILTHDLELYQLGNMGTDHSFSTTPAINIGQGITAGKMVQRIPDRTDVFVEGAGGVYVQDGDSTIRTNFGRRESYKGDTGLNDFASLSDAADYLLNQELGNRTSIQVTVIANLENPRPLVDYTVADTLQTQLPPIVTKTPKRVSQISYRNSEPTTYQVTLVEPPLDEKGD